MNAQKTESRTIMKLNPLEEERLGYIQGRLKRGDISRIAEEQEVSREWASMVLNGRGVSERILQAAELLIREREEQTN